jgi:hypothetical protein
MAQAPKGSGVHQTLDVHGYFFAKIALDLVVVLDDLAKLDNLVLAEVLNPD